MTSPALGYKAPARLDIVGVEGLPRIKAGDDLARIIFDGIARSAGDLRQGDVVIIAQKIVSKAEGRAVRLSEITPTAAAREMAQKTEKDPRLVELVLRESTGVVAHRPGVLIVEHHTGLVLANAGIDRSNVDQTDDGDETVLLLPENADASAAAIRAALIELCGADVAVIINDSLGRAWRIGTTGTAIGSAGLAALIDLNNRDDMQKRPLQATQIGLADELAAAASVVMGQADEARPVVIIRGLTGHLAAGSAADLVRPAETDLFR